MITGFYDYEGISDQETHRGVFCLSEVERRQQYIDMMVGGDADLKPLVTSCLEDVPKLRPLMANISARLKKMKEATKKTIHDGIDPLSSLGMVKQVSLSKIILMFCSKVPLSSDALLLPYIIYEH